MLSYHLLLLIPLKFKMPANCAPTIAGGPNLYVHDILGHVIQILKDHKMVVWLCNDYTQVLVQHIFTVPRYVMEITRHVWDGEFTTRCLPVAWLPCYVGHVS